MARSKYKKRKYKKGKSLARFFLAAVLRSFKMYTFEYIFNEVQLIGRKRNDDKSKDITKSEYKSYCIYKTLF